MMWIFSNWKLLLTASSVFALMLMTSAWQMATAQRNEARAQLQSYKQAAEAAATDAKIRSDTAVQEIRDAYHVQTQAIEQAAYRNAKARFGTCRPAGSRGDNGVQPGDSLRHSETGSAEPADGVPVEEPLVVTREFIEACAADAGVTELWKQWVATNELLITVTKP